MEGGAAPVWISSHSSPKSTFPGGRGLQQPWQWKCHPQLWSQRGMDGDRERVHPRSGWDGKRNRKGRIWEESSTAWVVSGKEKALDLLYKYSQANTRREQNISTGRRNSGENKGSGLEQVIPGYSFIWRHCRQIPAPAEGTACKQRGALASSPQNQL